MLQKNTNVTISETKRSLPPQGQQDKASQLAQQEKGISCNWWLKIHICDVFTDIQLTSTYYQVIEKNPIGYTKGNFCSTLYNKQE